MNEQATIATHGQQDSAYRTLLSDLTQGKWSVGQRLPSERQLATDLHCSRGTVRAVLNRLVEQDLLCCKDRSGYFVQIARRPNAIRNLALIVKSSYTTLSDYPYMNRLLHGLMAAAEQEHFLFNAFIITPKETFFTGIDRLQLNVSQYDGFILAWELCADEISRLNQEHIPFVSLTRPCCPASINYVDIDNFQGAYLGTRHLLETGHRTPVFMNGFERLSYNHAKVEGFRKALEEHGIPFSSEMVMEIDPDDENLARLHIAKLMCDGTPHFDGLMVYGGRATYSAIRELQKFQVKIPEQVYIIMYDDISWVIEALDMPMTAIHQPIENQIQAAVRLLLRQLNHPGLPPMSEIFQPSLRIRQTS